MNQPRRFLAMALTAGTLGAALPAPYDQIKEEFLKELGLDPGAFVPGVSPAARLDPAPAGREIRGRSPVAGAWRYASLPGLDVLTTAPDATAAVLVETYPMQSRALSAFWPAASPSDPAGASLIVCATPGDFLAVNPRGLPGSSGLVGVATTTPRIVLNLSGNSGPSGVNRPAQSIPMLVVRALVLDRVGSRAPAWLDRGLHLLVTQMDATRDSLGFRALLTDPTWRARATPTEENLQEALRAGTFFTLDRLFGARSFAGSGNNPSEIPGIAGLTRGNAGRATVEPSPAAENEAYAFIHYCLFGAGGKYREPFFKFVAQLTRAPDPVDRASWPAGPGVAVSPSIPARGTTDEATFTALFGVDYRTMLAELWRYSAVSQRTEFKLPAAAEGPLPTIAFRPATDAELGHAGAPVQSVIQLIPFDGTSP